MIRKTTILTMTFLVGLMMIPITMDVNATPGPCPAGHTDNSDGTCTSGYITGTVIGVKDTSSVVDTTCTATSVDLLSGATADDILLRDDGLASGYQCSIFSVEFDTTPIPDGAIITNTVYKNNPNVVSVAKNCDYVEVLNQPSTLTGLQLWGNLTAKSTTYVDNTANCKTVATYEDDLGTSADTDLQNLLTQNWFAVGVLYDDMTRPTSANNQNRWLDTAHQLQVTYTPPDLYAQIVLLQSQITSINATAQHNVEEIDDLYDFWDDLRSSIITWLAGRP